MKTAMRSPLRVFTMRHAAMMPPTVASPCTAGSSLIVLAPIVFEIVRIAHQRMAAQIQAERFLLEREQLLFRPRHRVRQARRGRHLIAAAVVVRSAAAEQERLTAFAILLTPAAMLDRAIDRREQPRAAQRARLCHPLRVVRIERIERARLRQALEHALVDQAQVDLLAHAIERLDLLLRRAHAEHRHGSRPRRRS